MEKNYIKRDYVRRNHIHRKLHNIKKRINGEKTIKIKLYKKNYIESDYMEKNHTKM